MPTIDDIIVGLEERIAELERRAATMVRHGRITDVDTKKQLFRVRLNPDTDQEPHLSAWVPYGQQAGAFKFHNPPSVGQNATLISPGGDPAQSVGLPFTWNEGFPSPGDSEDEHIITFGPIKISYDKKNEKYTASVGTASIEITKDKSIKMVADELIEHKVGGSTRQTKSGEVADTAARIKHNG